MFYATRDYPPSAGVIFTFAFGIEFSTMIIVSNCVNAVRIMRETSLYHYQAVVGTVGTQ